MLEYGLFAVMFTCAVIVALALIGTGVFITLYLVHKGYVTITTQEEEPAAAGGADDQAVARIGPQSARHSY